MATNRILALIEDTEYDKHEEEVEPEAQKRWTKAKLNWMLDRELNGAGSGALLVQIRLTDRGVVLEQVLQACPVMLSELPDLTIPETWSLELAGRAAICPDGVFIYSSVVASPLSTVQAAKQSHGYLRLVSEDALGQGSENQLLGR